MSYINGKFLTPPGKQKKREIQEIQEIAVILWSKPPLYYPTKIQKNIEKAKCFPDYF